MCDHQLPRIMLAAPASGAGKTTVTCALLQALCQRKLRPVSFKCGPDYIDPMFHREVLGVPSRNLDLFFSSAETVRHLLVKNSRGADLAVIEGVMGYYDGLSGQGTTASAYDVARLTATPVILVVNCRGMSVSVVAQIKGYLTYRSDSGIVGVILNQLAPMLYSELKELIEGELSLEVLGYLPKLADAQLESRHLGLITAAEVVDLQQKLQVLAEQVSRSVDIARIVALATAAPPLSTPMPLPDERAQRPLKVRIAVAQDRAFCFYYQDNLDLLAELGAELVPFSPLTDARLPPNVAGLLLGGGYPELYGAQLAQNHALLAEIRERLADGLPCVAECGGFMYLHETLVDRQGQSHGLVGAVQGRCYATERLQRFGYVVLTAEQDNLLCQAGECLRAHEFHYWDSTDCGAGFIARKPARPTNWPCVHSSATLYAGYPHLYFADNRPLAARLLAKMVAYRQAKGEL